MDGWHDCRQSSERAASKMAGAAWLGRRGASQAVVGPLASELVRRRGEIETGGNGWDGTWAMISYCIYFCRFKSGFMTNHSTVSQNVTFVR